MRGFKYHSERTLCPREVRQRSSEGTEKGKWHNVPLALLQGHPCPALVGGEEPDARVGLLERRVDYGIGDDHLAGEL